jgi:hypothetical protein
MKIGDLVRNPDSYSYLCCGSGVYPQAVVMSVEPLILVSEGTDMRWTKLDKDKLAVVGKASKYVVFTCLRRLSFQEKQKFLEIYLNKVSVES